MRRCLETAAPYLSRSGAQPAIEPRVSEIRSPPQIENRAHWLQERFPWRTPQALRRWEMLEPDLHAWRDAVLSFARSIGDDAAVFTHFIAINVIAGAALGREDTIVCRPDYASITEIEVRGDALGLVRVGAEMALGDVH
jgi:broad specificity phosphatase PhoE